MLKFFGKLCLIIPAIMLSTFAANDLSTISSFSDPLKSIPVVGNEYIIPATNTTLQQITAVPLSLEKGQVLLRRRFSANEYGLYTGLMNPKAYSKLSAFKPTENLTVSKFISRKIYSFQTENPDQDIENVYFDGDLIYVENMASIFYNDSMWKEIRMLDVLPCRLNITSDPPGAPVYINNEYQGVTPLYMGAIYEPTAVIKIDMKGYFIAENFIDLQNGTLLEKYFELKKKPVFDDGTEIDIEAYTAENTESVLEINQRIDAIRKSAKKIFDDSSNALAQFISNYPKMVPRDQFETTEEFNNRTTEYNTKFNTDMEELKKQYHEKRSRVLNVIPKIAAYLDSIKEREYTKYFDGNLLKLSTYNADSGFFPVTMMIGEKGFNFSFSGNLYIPRDEAKEFYSKGTGSGKIMLTYKNWQIAVARQDSLHDTTTENFYVYDKGLNLKFKDVDYELKGQCTYPSFITNSPEYVTFLNEIDKKKKEELLALKARGYLVVSTNPSGANLFLNGSHKGTTRYNDSLQPGIYNMVLQLNGYKHIFDTITITKDLKTEKGFVLEHTNAFLDSLAIEKKQASKTFRNVRRIVFSSLTVAIGGLGVLFENEAQKNYTYYKNLPAGASVSEFEDSWRYFKDYSRRRNICYVLSGASFGLFAISIPF